MLVRANPQARADLIIGKLKLCEVVTPRATLVLRAAHGRREGGGGNKRLVYFLQD